MEYRITQDSLEALIRLIGFFTVLILILKYMLSYRFKFFGFERVLRETDGPSYNPECDIIKPQLLLNTTIIFFGITILDYSKLVQEPEYRSREREVK